LSAWWETGSLGNESPATSLKPGDIRPHIEWWGDGDGDGEREWVTDPEIQGLGKM